MPVNRAMPSADEIVQKRDTSRRIVHIDMDAFFASVEQHDRPELRGRPIVVGRNGARGVVATASYEARPYGIRSAMPCKRAAELCPGLIFVPPRIDRYKEVSRSIHAIFRRYTDIIEPISLDEAFLDVTHNKAGLALGVDVAVAIKRAIREELGLVASAGVSYNKFLAKIASDWRKPDGLCTIHPDAAQAFIDRLPVEAFWGVGPATAAKFHELGVTTAPQLRAMPLSELIRHFGRSGVDFYRFVRGIDDRPVRVERIRKSVGCERTFAQDLRERAAMEKVIAELADELAARLTRAGFTGLTLTLKLRFFDFTNRSKSVTDVLPFDTPARIATQALALLAATEVPARGVRLIGLTVSTPAEEDGLPTLF